MKHALILLILMSALSLFAQQGDKAMPDNKPSLNDIHQFFATDCFNKTWDYLSKENRTPDDNETMLNLAYASAWHWSQIGTVVNHQRAQWLLAHVCTVLGYKEEALRHANRCLELTQSNKDQMEDFDVAYAYEGIARATALNGKKDKATAYLKQAQEASNHIKAKEDKEQFDSDLTSGEWYGVK